MSAAFPHALDRVMGNLPEAFPASLAETIRRGALGASPRHAGDGGRVRWVAQISAWTRPSLWT